MATTNSTADHSLDTTLDVLSHSTRRYVLWYLGHESTDSRVSVETLASAVAAWQTGDEESALDPEARERAHVSLRHVHLPRLESAELIERSHGSRAAESESEYVEAATDGTPVDDFLDAGLLGEFAECDRP